MKTNFKVKYIDKNTDYRTNRVNGKCEKKEEWL